MAGISVANPPWLEDLLGPGLRCATDAERVRLAIALARENVLRGTGGPFGAVVFETGTGAIVAAGVNSVVRLGNSALHAEMIAFMEAQRRLGSFTLAAPGLPAHGIAASCEPCAMCLGATLWSGARRLVCGASHEDARRIGFDEGPVTPASYAYLEARGIEVVRGILREEAREVLDLYRSRGDPIYNG